jgi:hypothetical protein
MSFLYVKPKKTKSAKKTKTQLDAEIKHQRELDRISLRFSGVTKLKHKSKKSKSLNLPSVPDDRQQQYPSLNSGGTPTSTSRNSIMDRLHLESEATAAAIIKKSKSISIPFNKGAYQYISDESDIKHIGKKA